MPRIRVLHLLRQHSLGCWFRVLSASCRTDRKRVKGPFRKLEEEFSALWKVPFNVVQAGEKDAVTFLQKWPHKVELHVDGIQLMLQLPQKASDKPKVSTPAAEVGVAVANAGAGAAAAVAKTFTATKVTPASPGTAANDNVTDTECYSPASLLLR